MARATHDPTPGGSDWLVEMLGEGRTRRRLVEALAVIGAVGTISGWGTAYYEVQREPMVQRMPLVFDSNLQLVGKLGGPVDPNLIDRLAVERGRDWVRLFRSRPTDGKTMQDNLNALAQLTDQRLYTRMGEKLEEHRKEYGKTAVDVTKLSGNLISRLDTYRRLVRIGWTERVQSGVQREVAFTATVTVAFNETAPLDQWGKNLAGFYVLDAQITEEGR